MTVRHLQSLHRSGGGDCGSGTSRQSTSVFATGPTMAQAEPSSSSSSSASSSAAVATAAVAAAVVHKFQTGYQECAGEVNRFVGRLDGVDEDIKKRLIAHLDSCVAKMRYVAAAAAAPPAHVNFPQPRQPLDPAAVVAAALRPLTAAESVPPCVVPAAPPLVGHGRTSAFTAVHADDRPAPLSYAAVYCDEPAVSSTSTWAEDTVAAASKNPLDFSMKKPAARKRPLGDVPVNVPATEPPPPSPLRKPLTGDGSTPPQRPRATASPARAPAPVINDGGAGSDPNMWRPW